MPDRLNVDENDFFRQATLRICGSLHMETAMRRCLEYLSTVLPADHLNLVLYDRGMEMVRTVLTTASPEEWRPIPATAFPVSEEALSGRDRVDVFQVERPEGPPVMVRIINDPDLDPLVSGTMLRSFGMSDSSLLVMRLMVEEKYLGNVVLRVAGKGRYTERHARLLALLREPFSIAMANVLEHHVILRLKDALADENEYLQRKLFHPEDSAVVGATGGLGGVMELVKRVAPLDSQVLLLGETGVGKDVVARAIHRLSRRHAEPFVKVNCGAIADTLLDSELFGHERGAFTGAMAQRRGYFERADRGTIFLDEIGELTPSGQVRMLRVLQYKEVQRVGGSTPVPVNVRVIAATNRNLDEMVKEGEFREDLWFRLNVFPIEVPPLRRRKGDIPGLVEHFIRGKWKELRLPGPPGLVPGAMKRLQSYDWPGNVRELENVVERALILSRGEPLRFDSIPGPASSESPRKGDAGDNPPVPLDEVIADHIRSVLRATHGKVHGPDGAARLLGVNPSTLRSRMEKLGIARKEP